MRAALAALLVLGACGGGGGAAVDAGAPDAVPARIEDLPVTEQVTMAGLGAPVDVVRDVRGVPHIYGRTLADVLRAEGYVMARDRFPQMEFLRRVATGRLSEVLGAVAASTTLPLDREARRAGYAAQGREIYAALAADDPSKVDVDAYVAGVNQYVQEILDAADPAPYIPRGAAVLGILYRSPAFAKWDAADMFATARYVEATLAFEGGDADASRALAGARAAFGVDPAANRRAGAFADLFSMRPARRAYTRDERGVPKAPRRPAAPAPLPSLAALDAASAALARREKLHALLGDLRGSNDWVVAGRLTASGAPILANDPHLQLIMPPVWWYVHLDTRRAGGDLDAMGTAFAGLPGLLLGWNEDLAWGATVTAYDVTDIYDETLAGDGAVRWKGETVPIETVTEVIPIAGRSPEMLKIEVVPHHGRILPGTKMAGHALSLRYTGDEPSNEFTFFLGLLSARSVDEARAAQLAFKVGSENFVYAARDGDIAWSTRSRVPVRDPRALDLAIGSDGIVTGHCPVFVLPGDGDFEWIGDLPPEEIPEDVNPARGYLATANADPVGVTDDGNPCNDGRYLGGRFELGFREGRILERLAGLAQRGALTPDDMVALQAETRSTLGDTMRDPLVASLSRTIAAAGLPAADLADLALVRDRLAAWSRATPHGVDATDEATIADSVATTIFAVGVSRIVPRAFGDEVEAIGVRPGSGSAAALLERALATPAELATYDPGIGDTVLWDDLRTEAVETRDDVVAAAFLDALAFVRGKLGANPQGWRWGRLHTVTFASVIPPVLGIDHLSVPPADDPLFPAGFPRHGDYGAIDVGNFSLWSPASFAHESGASQRLVVEMAPDGPRPRNALPGGQAFDPDSPHHRDEAALWIANQQPAMFFKEIDVVRHAEGRLRLVP